MPFTANVCVPQLCDPRIEMRKRLPLQLSLLSACIYPALGVCLLILSWCRLGRNSDTKTLMNRSNVRAVSRRPLLRGLWSNRCFVQSVLNVLIFIATIQKFLNKFYITNSSKSERETNFIHLATGCKLFYIYFGILDFFFIKINFSILIKYSLARNYPANPFSICP